MTSQRFVLHPGEVISEADGDRHWIGYHRLIDLYGLNPRHCRCATFSATPGHALYPPGAIHLGPRHAGDYDQIGDQIRADSR